MAKPPYTPVPGLPTRPEPRRKWSRHLDRQFAIYRDYLKHEDSLINHRKTWHGTWHGLLFTAMGVLLQWKPEGNTANAALVSWLKIILPVMGLVVAVVGFESIKAAYLACEELKKGWTKTKVYYREDLLPVVPNLTGGGSKRAEEWGRAGLAIPFAAFAAWFVILVVAALSMAGMFDARPGKDTKITAPGGQAGEKKADGNGDIVRRLAVIENKLESLRNPIETGSGKKKRRVAVTTPAVPMCACPVAPAPAAPEKMP